MEEIDTENLKSSLFDLNAKLIQSDGQTSLETIMHQNTVIEIEYKKICNKYVNYFNSFLS